MATGGARSLLAFWMGGAASTSSSLGGARSALAFWMGGAAGKPASGSLGGRRSQLAFWMGGAAGKPAASGSLGGPRSQLAFWMGGAASRHITPPPPHPAADTGGGPGRRLEWHEYRAGDGDADARRARRAAAELAERQHERATEEAFRRIAAGLSPYPEPAKSAPAIVMEELPPAVLLLLLSL